MHILLLVTGFCLSVALASMFLFIAEETFNKVYPFVLMPVGAVMFVLRGLLGSIIGLLACIFTINFKAIPACLKAFWV